MLTIPQINQGLKKSYDSQDSILRKRRAEKQLDVFLGVIEPYVREDLSRFYVDSNDIIVISFANVCKKAIGQLAALYIRPPEREFINCSDAQAEALRLIYKKIGMDQIMLKLNQMYKLSNQIHLQIIPSLDSRGQRTIAPRILYSQQLDVVPSPINSEIAEAYGISSQEVRQIRIDPNGDDEVLDVVGDARFMSVWTHEFNYILNLDGLSYNQDVRNFLGMVPIVEIAGDKYGTYFKTATESFSDFTVQFNASLSDAGQAKRFQGMPIGWIKGDPEQLKQDFTFGPNRFIKLPHTHDGQTSEIGFTNPNVSLDALINFDNSLLSLFLTCSDIDPKTINTKGENSTYTSGYERFLAVMESFKPSQMDEDLFRASEDKIVKLIARILTVYGGVEGFDLPNVGTIPDNVAVNIEFKSPDQIMSKSEELDVMERERALGLISEVEQVAAYRKTSIEEAQKFIDEQNQGA